MSAQIENTYPSGVRLSGYKSEISPVVMPLNGAMLASTFTAMASTTAINEARIKNELCVEVLRIFFIYVV